MRATEQWNLRCHAEWWIWKIRRCRPGCASPDVITVSSEQGTRSGSAPTRDRLCVPCGELLTAATQASEIEPLQAVARAAVVHLLGLVVVRCGSKRMLGRSTAFDVIVGVMVGSLPSRAVNGGGPVVATLAGTAALVALHWAVGFPSHGSDTFDRLFNGTATVLIDDGRPGHRAMRQAAVSHRDIQEAARCQARRDRIGRPAAPGVPARSTPRYAPAERATRSASASAVRVGGRRLALTQPTLAAARDWIRRQQARSAPGDEEGKTIAQLTEDDLEDCRRRQLRESTVEGFTRSTWPWCSTTGAACDCASRPGRS